MLEETPLLGTATAYDRFTRREKRIHVAVVAWTALLPLFVSGSFVPSIPRIALDLNSTGPVISLAVSISVFATGIGSLTWASYSTFYGRRPIYLFCLPFLCAGSLGVARSTSVPELLIWRFMQALGSSCGFSLGAAVIADLYKLEERGTAMGVFYGAAMLGPALAPVCGGLAAHYASWRHMQYSLGMCGMIAFIAVAACLPETCHQGTRGIDKLGGTASSRKFVWINPFASLGLLRSPNLLAMSFLGTTTIITDFVLLIPLAYTIGQAYGIKNEALIGACFLPSGLGNMVGGVFAGRLSDTMVKKWRNRRGGEWVPEDRLRAMLFSAAVLLPVSVLGSGFATRFVGGPIGLTLNLIFLFLNGVGLTSVLSTMSSYAVDILHSRSAEAVAASNSFRAFVLAFGSAAILPLIETIGPLGTNAVAAGLAWIGFGLLYLTIRYGDRMRNWVDMGYSTAEDN